MAKFNPTPKVSGKYGAPLGRPNCSGYFDGSGEWCDLSVLPNARPFRLVRLTMDSGGYDQGGAYWGLNNPVYYFEGPLSDIHGYVNASTRDAAKLAVTAIHQHARFYR